MNSGNVRADLQDVKSSVCHLIIIGDRCCAIWRDAKSLWSCGLYYKDRLYKNAEEKSDVQKCIALAYHRAVKRIYEQNEWSDIIPIEDLYKYVSDTACSLTHCLTSVNDTELFKYVGDYVEVLEAHQPLIKKGKEAIKNCVEVIDKLQSTEIKSSVEALIEMAQELVSIISRLEPDIRAIKESDIYKVEKKRFGSSKKIIKTFPTLVGLEWKEVSIEVISDSSIKIKARDVSDVFSFDECGFRDGRRPGFPDSKWKFLLAMAKTGGEITREDNLEEKIPAKLTQAIKVIKKRLQTLLNISDGPFEDCRKYNKWGYKTKFILLDRRNNVMKTVIRKTPKEIRTEEIADVLNEECPILYDGSEGRKRDY